VLVPQLYTHSMAPSGCPVDKPEVRNGACGAVHMEHASTCAVSVHRALSHWPHCVHAFEHSNGGGEQAQQQAASYKYDGPPSQHAITDNSSTGTLN
jgi:hypothetical protein